MENLMIQTGNTRPRWMIVDDDKDILSLLPPMIARCVEVDLQCFRSPRAALAWFEAAPGAVDFVITDL